MQQGVERDPLPDGMSDVRARLIAAAREFNRGRYFEAHEVLEDALDEVPDELWELFTGLIQISVGYHKATQELWSGAARMLASGLGKIDAYPSGTAGLDLNALCARVGRDVAALRGREFDLTAFRIKPPRLRFQNSRQ